MYIDFKETNWRRIQVPEDIEQVVLADLEMGRSAECICEDYQLVPEEIPDIYPIDMSIEENNFASTIEVYNDQFEMIWENGEDEID